MDCRVSLVSEDHELSSLSPSLLSYQSAISDNSFCSLMYHFSPTQASDKSDTERTHAVDCNVHQLLYQHNTLQQMATKSSATAAFARSLAAGESVSQFPSEPSPALNNAHSFLTTSPTSGMANDTSAADLSGHAVDPSRETTTPPGLPAPHGLYNQHISERNDDHDHSRSVTNGNSTKMAAGLGMMGLLVLSLIAACVLARHVKVSILLPSAPLLFNRHLAEHHDIS